MNGEVSFIQELRHHGRLVELVAGELKLDLVENQDQQLGTDELAGHDLAEQRLRLLRREPEEQQNIRAERLGGDFAREDRLKERLVGNDPRVELEGLLQIRLADEGVDLVQPTRGYEMVVEIEDLVAAGRAKPRESPLELELLLVPYRPLLQVEGFCFEKDEFVHPGLI